LIEHAPDNRRPFFLYEEQEIAVGEMHRLVFNITVSVQDEIRRRSIRRSRKKPK